MATNLFIQLAVTAIHNWTRLTLTAITCIRDNDGSKQRISSIIHDSFVDQSAQADKKWLEQAE